MGRVLTNNLAVAYAIEETLGNLPVSPTWNLIEPNTINAYGADITTVAREPISNLRQRRKGTVTDLDSSVEFEADLINDHFIDFIEGFMFSQFRGGATFVPTAVTSGGSGGYTVPSGGTLAANTLVYARGFQVSGNNGLKVVASGSTGTNIRVDGLTAEASPPTNVSVEVAGVRGATGDIQVNAGGNLTSTILDFTTLGLTVGQAIWVGGTDAANRFDEDVNNGNNRAFVRVTAIAANLLTIDKRSVTFTTDTAVGKEIDLHFGRFTRNVRADDSDYIERSFQFEVAYAGLANPSGDEYEYAQGNFCNQLTLNVPLTNKATGVFNFVGTDAQPPSTTRATNAATPILPVQTTAYNTSSDIARLRITQLDETGLTTDFTNLTITLNNQVTPEKVLARLGARFLNTGTFLVDIEAEALFTDSAVAAAIRNNTTVTMDFALRNDDGGIFFDIPSLTLGNGARSFPVNETVRIALTGAAFVDPTLQTSGGISIFPFVPSTN